VFNVAEAPHILVVPSALPVKDLAGFIAYAKANPGKCTTLGGGGSPPHLAADQFARLAGLQLCMCRTRAWDRRSPNLVAGRLQIMSMSYGSARPHLKERRVEGARGGIEAPSRRPARGADGGGGGLAAWEMSAWFGIFAPRDTKARRSCAC